MSRLARAAAIVLVAALIAPVTADAKIVVRGKYQSLSGKTITYSSSKGTYSATWIGTRHYRLRGTISGKKLRGSFRTRQADDRKRFLVRGSGRLGGRKVKIRGSGPNSLRATTLILR